MLTGDNGILTQANNAKEAQIEGQVKEEINLAIQAVKMYAEQKAVQTENGWLAETKIGTNDDTKGTDTVIGQLKNDLGSDYTYSVADKVLTITYASSDYKSATNNKDSKIEVDITIESNKFEIGNFDITK